ncbi:MAG TPA: PAS domain S-box protein [Gaiellaceae bacterium]|jgi:PAS domain S-box-containing protein
MTDHEHHMPRFDFRTIVEHLPLVVYVDELDEKSTPLYVSPQIERLLGYSAAEWLNDRDLFISCIHPDDREQVLEDIAVRNSQGISAPESDYRLIARDGRIVWVRDDEIVVNGAAQGFLQDVTVHKQDQVRLELLVGILSLAADETPPDEIVAHAAGRLADLFGNVHVSYVERREEGGFYIRYTTDVGKPEFWDEVEWSADYVKRLETGAPIVLEDVNTAAWLDPIRDRLIERNVASFVDVPLLRHGELQGVLWFNSSEPRMWGEHEVSLLVDVAGQLAVVLTNARAREQRVQAERDLRSRDAILEAVSHSAERLVAEPNWRTAAPLLLRALGRATDASRAYLFETGVRPDGRRTGTQRFEWVANGITQELENEVMQDMCFDEVGLADFAQRSARNEIFAANVSDLTAPARRLFEAQEIRSFMTVPVFVHGDWWGFIGFDDCVSEREWSPAEMEALRTAASVIEAAIERERAEVVLREHEQKLRAVYETALDAIFITDDDRRYVDVNPAACEYLGVATGDLIGRRIDEFLPPHKLATVEEDWAAYIGGGPVLEEWQNMRSDGSVRTAEASAHPNFQPGLHIAFLRDVTERKQLEAELLNAQKLESLGRLAGGVAHDFNNLLTGISGYASLLQERARGDRDLSRDLGEIKRAADRATELTKQLLAFGRRQMLRPRPLDLNAVITDVAGLLQRLLGDHIELVVRAGPELGVVQADPGQVEQVIVNLVVNARDALPAGGRVTIETRNADGWVELVVADDGVGMDESTRAQVFEPFFTTRDDGVGLGLASVYGIVHQSGGDVAVQSDPDVGSIFTVRLPRINEAAEIEPVPPIGPEPRNGSETVLLVEDEDVVRDLARRVLERHGYTVFACSHGAEAVELSDRHEGKIDLLLTDVVMPGLRGYEVAREVSAARPGIKILYMSGYAEEALGGERAVGDAALIEKPFAIDALARRVREVLEPTG